MSGPLIAPALVLTALLLAACAADVRARRIPNALVLAVLGAGLARAALASGLAPAAAAHGPYAASLWAAALGALVGLAAWLPFYAAGVLGAGDVKLFAAAAAWLGPQGVLPATTYAALAGGALALVWMLRRRAPARAGRDARLPYGVAISAGVLITVWGAGA